MPRPRLARVLAAVAPLGLILAGPSAIAAADDWQDPTVIGRNKQPAHATLVPYATVPQALEEEREASPYYRSLNGDWKFHWVEKPADRLRGFHELGFDDAGWDTIPVPANWQLHGHGRPIYINQPYPFAPENPDPPNIPAHYNPVGSYRTTFEVPTAWDGRQVFLHFAGVKSAFSLWVNGEAVGHSQGSMTPAEFDVTPYLREGENLLAAEVFRWSDGSYLEDQDTWRLSGICRDVFLYSTPGVHIADFAARTELDESYRYGIYVMDEANLETHGVTGQLTNDPTWHAAFVDRAVSLVERDKNHPSVILYCGTGLLVVGQPHLSVAAWPYTMEDLEKATHIHELPRRETITLNLDHRQMGVGGDDGWGARAHPEYALESRPYDYRFRLRAYAPEMGPPEDLARQRLPEL
jgi:hypothetical protein